MSEFAVIVILLTSWSTYSEWCVHYDAGEVEIKVIYLRGHESILEIVNASVYCQLGHELRVKYLAGIVLVHSQQVCGAAFLNRTSPL